MDAAASFLDILSIDPASLIFCISSVMSFLFFFSPFHNPLAYFQLPNSLSMIPACSPASYAKYLICAKNLCTSSDTPKYWLYHKPYHLIFKLNPYMVSICLMEKTNTTQARLLRKIFCMCSDFLNFNISSWFPLRISTKNE